MRPILFFIMVLVIISMSQPSMCGVVDDVEYAVNVTEYVLGLFGQEYWDSDWSVTNGGGEPKKNVKSDAHIRAWIDIIGFDEESVINGTHYVNGSAKDFAIVKRDAWHMSTGGTTVSFTSTYSISDSLVGNATNNETNTTTATQTTKFHWKYKVTTLYGFYWVHVYEGPLTVSYTTESPENFTTRIPDVQVQIQSYNQTFSPVTYIHIPLEDDPSMDGVMISRVSYNGSNISRYDQVGWVIENDRGTEHVEFVDDGTQPSWRKDDNQSVIDHCGRLVTIFEPSFNISLLNISLHTPYETRYITNYSIETIEGNAKINIPLVKVIALLVGAFIAIIIILKVVKRAL